MQNLSQDELFEASENMQRYGGSFMQALGVAFSRADAINKSIILREWNSEFVRYANFNK